MSDAPAEGKPTNGKTPLYKRPIFWIVVVVGIIAVAIGGVVWWLEVRYQITTDDAFVATHNTTVSPRVAGHVEQVLVDDNQEVKKGELLLVLDDRDFVESLKSYQAALEMAQAQELQARSQVASAKASVAQAQADVISADANAAQARSDLDRYLNVQKVDPRAVSKQVVDQATATARTTAAQLDANKQKQGAAEAQVKVAEAQIVAAQAAIDKARADVENAKLQLSYAKVYAAEDGQVTSRSVEVGNYITPGQALMALVPFDLKNVWVNANFKETQLRKVRVGQSVKIHIDAYDMDIPGHVQSIQAGSGAAFSLLPPENATGNYVKVVQRIPVKITFDWLPERRLAAGMSVEPVVNTSAKSETRNPKSE
ncbi:MAG TPA: HlyD family secretion protein [Humisphaera sp.]|nr:HlyD family secretion protein [Humisphaera sp.]